MSQPFLITGLPRSRTAWFAVTAGTGRGVLCRHEASADCQSFGELIAMWRNPAYQHVGISDHALGFQLERILRAAVPRTLVIDRPIGDVRASILAFMAGVEISVPAIDHFLECLSEALALPHPLVRHIAYRDLQDRDALIDAFSWILPGVEICDMDDLMRMNIQVDRAYALERARRPHSHWYRAAA